MTSQFDRYRSTEAPLPRKTWAWNMYGPGLEHIGREGRPELFDVQEPGDDQLLVRVDAVGMCFSDVKLIQQGGKHPKLYNRDLAVQPTRLGHEAALTIVRVGKELASQFKVGERYAIQPDIYQNGMSTAYGYTIPGGLTQYHLIGPEVLHADAGSYLLPLEGELGYAETALTEPWACVEASYTQRRRLAPKAGGTMWIVGRPGDTTTYVCSAGLEAPSLFVATDVPASLFALLQTEAAKRSAKLVVRDALTPDEYAMLKADLTGGAGFDDIVVLDPRSAAMVGEAAKLIARRGTFALVGTTPLDGPVQVDVGRIHYDYTAYVGCTGPDVAGAYGEARNRCELRSGGVAVFVGAGGPMGQMHVQRALELPDGPAVVIATDTNTARLEALTTRLGRLANKHGRRLLAFNPTASTQTLANYVAGETTGKGADDVVVSVPVAAVMADAARALAPDGMLVFFAGVPNGTLAPLDLSQVYLHNAQFTGTSGSRLEDQALTLRKALDGRLSPNQSVAAVGGMEAAHDGLRDMMSGRFPGKIVIFPQITGLPLTGLDEIKSVVPELADCLGPGDTWTPKAEAILIERFWKP